MNDDEVNTRLALKKFQIVKFNKKLPVKKRLTLIYIDS